MTGGELGNSSASSAAYMTPIWPKLQKMHLNTVIAPVYWELLEPQEGKFNFTLVDDLIKSARQYHMKLVLLWFGTWKNSMSCYAPGWVKTNENRFPRVANSVGGAEEIITPFSKDALQADIKAFSVLMRHIKQTDSKLRTVLMVQVENEIGMLPDARDHSKLADEAFNRQVPTKLISWLNSHKDKLVPEMQKIWQAGGSKTSGNWESVFGKSPATDELFMACYFAEYANAVAKAGKAVYPLPMYVNAALNAPGKKPGQYPSAGPLPHLIDVWKAAAPDIDLLSPDFYNPNFKYWNDRYTRPDNALFIPEHRFEDGMDAKAFYAIGHYKALGFSPFSIETDSITAGEPLSQSYNIIHQLSGEISKAKRKGTMDGVLLSKDADTIRLQMGDYMLTVSHDLALGWSPKAKDANWPLTGGIITALANDEFYVAGTGLVISFKPVKDGLRAGILQVDEGIFVNGKWQPGRRLNGDEDHQGRHLRIPLGEYGIQRIKLYNYK
ncbi:beta-galactosidase [Mucilaginibacter rubeus]|nr:beta-galactosidase [Mucilaginibacter rubeus]